MIKRLLLLSIVLVAAATVAVNGFWNAYRNAQSEVVVREDGRIVDVVRGDSFATIIAKLKKEQIAVDPFWFRLLARQKNVAHRLKAGEYALEKGMTMPDLLALLVSGKVRQYAITIPEGWTFRQIVQLLADQPKLRHTLNGDDHRAIMAQLGDEQRHPEGLFFPDTYFYEKQTADIDLLRRAYTKMQRVLHQEWQAKQQGLPFQTPYEALILASIVEKETARPEERAKIAGVFIRRLHKGMLLQTDPTVIYGLGEDYDGNIRARDLKTPTPYNTYLNGGLPPTPIAMPGQDAIHAVLHPEDGNSLYFVSRGDGYHIFSSSLRQHINAVNQYQKRRR